MNNPSRVFPFPDLLAKNQNNQRKTKTFWCKQERISFSWEEVTKVFGQTPQNVPAYLEDFMRTIITTEEMASYRRCLGKDLSIGFVPTMGALHKGHISLVKRAKELSDLVVTSIFVNPTQFGPNEDFAQYPRTLEVDLHKLQELEVSAVFIPNAKEMFPENFQTYVVNTAMDSILCGASRKNHFRGVLTVLLKLFNLVKPDYAIFGKKDYQQLRLIETMTRELGLNLEVVGSKIYREQDGLAMSSRNLFLEPDLRSHASALFAGLGLVQQEYARGERQVQRLMCVLREHIKQTPFSLEYSEIRSQTDLSQMGETVTQPGVCLVAGSLGGVRLIDNLELGDL